MAKTRPSAEYVALQGEAIYNDRLRQTVEPGNCGRYVVIDIESQAYRVGDDHRATVLAFLEESPGAVLYTKLIGYTTAGAIGGRMQPEVPAHL